MEHINEKELEKLGFVKLYDGSTLVLIDMYKDSVKDIVVAKRVLSTKGLPLEGFLFVGLNVAEYIEDLSKVRRLFSL